MAVGNVVQKVVVTSQVALLNTDNANISTEVDSKQIVELPLNLRNIFALTTLNSSVNNNSEGQQLLGGGGNTTDDADQDISFLNFAGGFFGSTAFMLDGAWDTDPEWGIQSSECLIFSSVRMEHRKCSSRYNEGRNKRVSRRCVRVLSKCRYGCQSLVWQPQRSAEAGSYAQPDWRISGRPFVFTTSL
jgi:hypothetical protein